jgi:hypothetical protein
MGTRPRRLNAVFALLTIGFCGLSSAKGAESTEIVLLGTLHGVHQQNARYSLEILRDLIVQLKPAAILIELPPTIGGQPTIEKQRITGRFRTNENWSANTAADVLQIPVIAYDREGRNEFYQETKYFDRQKQLSRRIDAWLGATDNQQSAPAETAILGPLSGNASRSQRYFDLHSGPEIINSEGYDRLIRLKHFLIEELMPQLSTRVPPLRDLTVELAFFRDEWHERNQIMEDNVAKQAKKYPARRIVVLCGSEHRYILRDLLSTQHDIVLSEFYEAAPPKP